MDKSKDSVKLCAVCGDIALGYNYKGLTCESCKTFFQRNASKSEKTNCLKNSNCPIDVSTRKSCSKCRLAKCHSIGMKFKNKINKNKSIQQSCDLNPIENILENLIKDHISIDQSSENQEIHIKTRKRNYATDLSAHERSLLDELQSALEVFPDETSLPVTKQFVTIQQSLNWPTNYSKILLKFLIKFSIYNTLNQQDKLYLYKKSFMKIIMLRTVYLFDFKQGGYPVIANESANESVFVKFELMDEFKNQKLVQDTKKFFVLLYQEMEKDATIRDLLIGIKLFMPHRDVSCPEWVNYHFQVYCRLLHRYLEQKYKNVNQANQKCTTLIKMMYEYDDRNEQSRVIFDEIDVTQFSDLLVELYELT